MVAPKRPGLIEHRDVEDERVVSHIKAGAARAARRGCQLLKNADRCPYASSPIGAAGFYLGAVSSVSETRYRHDEIRATRRFFNSARPQQRNILASERQREREISFASPCFHDHRGRSRAVARGRARGCPRKKKLNPLKHLSKGPM